MIIALSFLLLSFSAYSQLEVRIDSIVSNDSNSLKRKFSLAYRITNKTAKPVSFFLLPESLIANAASSLTLFVVYKIYQNHVFQDMDGPFFEHQIPKAELLDDFPNHNSPEAIEIIKKINEKYKAEYLSVLENYKNNGGTATDNSWIMRNYRLLQSKVTLQPNETKAFVIKTSWDKIRATSNGDLEYFLNEKDLFEIEFVLDLKKSLFKDDLSATEFSEIMKDPNFIQGVFTSDKKKINFGE
ncbi:hypothetical protein FNO01nite_21890 [Flavobacterium noncentrifugens]|nr:hypothetical protein FNO01nite_21890 [Flavobacterium noncentrifugens]